MTDEIELLKAAWNAQLISADLAEEKYRAAKSKAQKAEKAYNDAKSAASGIIVGKTVVEWEGRRGKKALAVRTKSGHWSAEYHVVKKDGTLSNVCRHPYGQKMVVVGEMVDGIFVRAAKEPSQ